MDKEKGLKLTELYEGVGVEDVRAATGCSFQVSPMTSSRYLSQAISLLQVSDNLKPMRQI